MRDLLTPEQMYSKPWSVVGKAYYPAGCSFVGYLVRRFDVARLRAFLAAFDCDSQNDVALVAAAFERVFGTGVDQADREWRESLSPGRSPSVPEGARR